MSTNTKPEIEDLKQEVANVYGGRISTTNDFSELSEAIKKKTGQLISDSTLKRIWGYVNYNPQPHTSTLNIIAQYAGHNSFRDFCNSRQISSSFFVCDRIVASELECGDKVLLGWSPDREVILEFLGDIQFKVVDGSTSKLQSGDIVETSEFLKGFPLFFGKVMRGQDVLPAYVAGKSLGLNKLEKIY